MLSPLVLGYIYLAAKLSNGYDIELSSMFRYYSSFKEAMRAWISIGMIYLPIKLFDTLFNLAIAFFKNYSGVINIQAVVMLACLTTVVLLLSVILLAILLCRAFALPCAVVCGNEQKTRVCIKSAITASKGRIMSIASLFFSFIPWILLSVCTVYVLFFIFTIPYMSITYIDYSSYILTDKYRIYYQEDF